jgi:hypothetical protein
MDDLRANMAKGGRPGKDLWHRESACRHAESGRRGAQGAEFESNVVSAQAVSPANAERKS